MKTILFITDDTDKISSYRKTFIDLEWSVEVYNSIEKASVRILSKNAVDVLVCETLVKGSAIDGLSFARKMISKYPVVLMSSKDNYVTEAKQSGFVAFKRTGTPEDNIFNRVARATDLFEKEQGYEKLKKDMRIVKHDFHCINSGIVAMNERIDHMTNLLENHKCSNTPEPDQIIEDKNGELALIKTNRFLVSAKKSPLLTTVLCLALLVLGVTGINTKYIAKTTNSGSSSSTNK